MNFRQLDLNLLRVLAAIHRTGSVTAAGRSLALSQPATSNGLARLREAFGDELFVRSRGGLTPTRLCDGIAPGVFAQLAALEDLVSRQDDFTAEASRIRWRLSLSDLGEMMFLPPLAAALRSRAPLTRLSNVSVAAGDVPAALEAREIDFAIGILNPRHRQVTAEPLFRERYVAITAAGWPAHRRRPGSRTMAQGAIQALSSEALAEAPLVVASPTATFHDGIERMLARQKLAERITVRARHFGALPELVLQTDLVAIVPEMYARNARERHDIRIWNLPDAWSPVYDVRLVWHLSTARDASHVWLRALVRQLFARADA